jgi:hypothetical protein
MSDTVHESDEAPKVPASDIRGLSVEPLYLPYKNESDEVQAAVLINTFINKKRDSFYPYLIKLGKDPVSERYIKFVIWYCKKEYGMNFVVVARLNPGDRITDKNIDDFVENEKRKTEDIENGEDEQYDDGDNA